MPNATRFKTLMHADGELDRMASGLTPTGSSILTYNTSQ